jgi:hypothetical protein
MTEDFSTGRLLYMRRITRAVSEYLVAQLKEHLTTVSPLLRPRRLLGDYIESGTPEQVADADKNFAALNEIYSKAAGKPFELPRPLRPPIKPVGLSLEIYPWEYRHEIRAADATHAVTITSPVRFVVSYSSGLSFSRLRLGIAGKEDCKQEDVREYVIRCCLMHLMLSRYSGIASLFRALRWEVNTAPSPDLGALPLTTLAAPIQTMLPPDGLILESTELSGMSQFEEVVDLDAVSRVRDPLIERVDGIIAAARPAGGGERA